MRIYRHRTVREVCLAALLYDAIEDQDINSVNNFLIRGADCNLVLPKRGIAPLHLAIGLDSEDFSTNLTVLLLQNKADPNVKTDDGLTTLHIGAAYGRKKILHRLLCCGGNPDIRDVNHKKPIDYAHQHSHKECVDLLLSFMERPTLFSRKELSPAFNLTLEKILVENGDQDADYEFVQEYKTEPLNRVNLETLHNLPDTDTTDYVMKWCQNHVVVADVASDKPLHVNSTNSLIVGDDSHESSCDESDGGKSVEPTINDGKITFRKRYQKKRKISRSISTTPPISPIGRQISQDEKSSNNDYKCAIDDTQDALITVLPAFSKESGIMTLPSSRIEDFDDEPPILHNRSSDYNTCPSVQEVAISSNVPIDKNIFEITNDLSLEEEKSRRSSTKSEGISSDDISFVSVSEVYKYIDGEQGVVLFEKRLLKSATSDYAGSVISSSISSKLSSLPASADYDTDTLRKELTVHGYDPGPITFTTKRVYLKKLKQIKKHPQNRQTTEEQSRKIYSLELEKTLRDSNWLKNAAVYKTLEETLSKEFDNPQPTRKWREGNNKCSFTYLLLDPRITNNLPCRAELLDSKEVWQVFLSSIFYVGKGKRSRPYSHLYEAARLWREGQRTSTNKKIDHILRIWNENQGVVCLHVFQNVIPVEAYTREAAMISALKLDNLKNIKSGEFYGVVSTWNQKQKKLLGTYLLHKAMMIFLNEGERQLCPSDIE